MQQGFVFAGLVAGALVAAGLAVVPAAAPWYVLVVPRRMPLHATCASCGFPNKSSDFLYTESTWCSYMYSKETKGYVSDRSAGHVHDNREGARDGCTPRTRVPERKIPPLACVYLAREVGKGVRKVRREAKRARRVDTRARPA